MKRLFFLLSIHVSLVCSSQIFCASRDTVYQGVSFHNIKLKKHSVLLQDTCLLNNKIARLYLDSICPAPGEEYLRSYVADTCFVLRLDNFLEREFSFSHNIQMDGNRVFEIKKSYWKKYKKKVSVLVGGVTNCGDTILIVQLHSNKAVASDRNVRSQLSLIAGTKNLKYMIIRKEEHDYSFLGLFPANLF